MPAELNEKQALEAAKFLQAIAHPKRLLLLAALSDRQLPAWRLAAAVGLPSGMVYKHLHKLVEIGLLSVNVKAAGMRFSIASPETVVNLVKIQLAVAAQIGANLV